MQSRTKFGVEVLPSCSLLDDDFACGKNTAYGLLPHSWETILLAADDVEGLYH
jgi:hypothetical protein